MTKTAAFIDASDSWALPLAVTLLVFVCISGPILCYLLWLRRSVFPVNATPAFLSITTQLGSSLYVISLLIPIISPQCPCWLYILLAWADLFPFYCGAALQLFRAWFIYSLQRSMSRQQGTRAEDLHRGEGEKEKNAATAGKEEEEEKKKKQQQEKRDWFTSHTFLVSDSFLKRMLLLGGILTFIVPAVQLSVGGVDLGAQLRDAECLIYRAEAGGVLFRVLWWSLLSLNAIFAFLIRNMDDAFNLSENWKQIFFFFSMGLPLNSMATAATGLPLDARENAFSIGQFAYVGASLTYMWYATVSPVRLSYERERDEKRESEQEKRVPVNGAFSLSSHQHVGHGTVRSTAELRALLVQRETAQSFKKYLVKEFCVENLLFIQAVERLKGEEKREKRDAIIKEIGALYVAVGSQYEINVVQSLRNAILGKIDALSSSASSPSDDFFGPMEEEVYRMLLEPYNRYVRQKNGSLRRNSSSSIVKVAPQ